MNQYKQVPRRGPDKRKVITDSFPKSDPIFWGPNQRILPDDVYVPPSGFKVNRILAPPKVVRFIHDAHQEYVGDDCTYTAQDFRIQYHAVPVNPPMGELPWVNDPVDGEWFPDKDTATTMVEVFALDEGGEGFHVYELGVSVDDAVDEGYLRYDYWRVEVDFVRSDGSTATGAFLTNEEPVISWVSDRPHLLTNVPCTAYPTGCACTGP